ncbi:vomeronasal type-2 receptor 26-like [Pelobates fuscus]|uniref:vomeronasal type-2 receptor 26-like n=1 Tax=Pelobates fuscus TaxID=191477 RepID=UPI002FE4CF9A
MISLGLYIDGHLVPGLQQKKKRYNQDGDFIIGGLITVNVASTLTTYDYRLRPAELNTYTCVKINLMSYQNLVAFIFAISEINENLEILPNITLGFYTADPCFSENYAVKGILNIISTEKASSAIPNYRCGTSMKLVGFVDGISSKVTLLLARMFGSYKIPQISYSSLDSTLSDKVQFPSFYRTVPNENIQYKAIVKLLRYFGWSWVGMLVSDDESGLKASQVLQEELSLHGYCVAFLEFLPYRNKLADALKARIAKILKTTKANAIVIYADQDYVFQLQTLLYMYPSPEKIWIISYHWNLAEGVEFSFLSFEPFNGSLSFTIHTKTSPNFEDFSQNVNPVSYPNDFYINRVWMELYDCNYIRKSGDFELCMGNETIRSKEYRNIHKYMSQYSYTIYNAVYALAHALHELTSEFNKEHIINEIQAWKVNKYLKNMHFINTAEEDIYFDENGDFNSQLDILNWIVNPDQSIDTIKVGHYNQQSLQDLTINKEMITWNPAFQQTQHSVCSESCIPGYRKSYKQSRFSCCYDCVHCPQGEITNDTDMETCTKCPDRLWPNEKKDTCIPKLITYLSYEDLLGESLAVASVLLFLITCLVTTILIKHRNTPVVKANNRDLSFILLVSLKICFLCSLLFIGYPHKLTCILRQTVFGIIFSISVSSILAKTVTVIIAFNATKPGSKLKNWVGSRSSNSILLCCSLIQVIICCAWLGISPPFPHENMEVEVGTIVAECNDGSQIGFYSVLGYMGFLAFVSFFIAFLARNLPDMFNEARFITFSMLVFLSVWISFIPAYLSTKGKYVVAVEIFAILTSSTGLLGCIFIPKCYVILIRPERNTRAFMIKQ